MNVDQLLKQVKEFRDHRDSLIVRKAGDYARQHHIFSNFYEVAKITNRRPEEVILTHLATKISRLSTLFENLGPEATPNNESVVDSMSDLANYADFLAVLHMSRFAEVVGATPTSLR